MVAYKSWDFDKLLTPKRPIPKAVLIYGTDEGVISSRVQLLLHHWLNDQNYRENIISIDVDDILHAPDTLLIALNSQSLFGDNQAVHTRIGTKNIIPALEISLVSGTLPLLIQGSALAPNHPVRKYFEQNDHIISIPCYPENDKDIERNLLNLIRREDVSIDRSTQTYLISLLSSNPEIRKNEIEKLLLFTYEKDAITQQDILDIMVDLNDHNIDELISALFSCNHKDALSLCDTLLSEGIHPSVFSLLILRHCIILLKIYTLKNSGQSFEAIFKSIQPPIFPKRQVNIQHHLAHVSRETLLNLLHICTESLYATRSKNFQPIDGLKTLLQKINLHLVFS